LKIAVGSTALCLLLDVVKLTYLAPPKQCMQRGFNCGIPVPTVYQFKKKQVPRNGLQESAILEEV
jgi:hypothetical protein